MTSTDPTAPPAPVRKPLLRRGKRGVARMEPMPRRAEASFAGPRRLADSGLEKLRPLGARLDHQLRRSSAVAAGLDGASGVWMRLVESFCATVEPWLARWFPEERLIAVAGDDGSIALHRAGKGEVLALGALGGLEGGVLGRLTATRWSSVELRLPRHQVLQRSLSLPGSSRDFLKPIIEHRLERLTPWAPDKVLYGYGVKAEKGAASLEVTLLATSRDMVAEPLARLGAAGFSPTAIGAAGEAGQPEADLSSPLPINMIGAAAGPVRARSLRVVSLAAMAVLAGVLCAYVATAIVASDADGAQQDAARKLVKARRLLRAAQLGDVGERERTMLVAKQPDYSTAVLLAKLASALPQNTYLKELNVAPDKLQLAGSTTDAPALIAKLEAIGLGNVRFSSAVTREKSGRDSFEITAERPAPPTGDAP